MWRFSESVNEYLEKELVTKENESSFLLDFKKACDNQIDLSDDMNESGSNYKHIVTVWGENLPINYDVDIDEDGILSTIDEEIDFDCPIEDLQKKEFKDLIKSILDDGNTATFAINDPDNEGIVVNEWSVLKENGSEVPNEELTSQTVLIDEEVAWDIVRELGIAYPVIYDESTGEQIQ